MQNKYAQFLLKGCLKLEKGDKLFIIGNNLINDFITIVKEEAKKIGIKDIETLIRDYTKEKELFLTNDLSQILVSPILKRDKYNTMAKEGYAFLNLSSPYPGIFDDIDASIIESVANMQAKSIELYREYQNKGLIKWNISAVPNPFWVKSINLSLDQLWNLIYDICLIKDKDPIASWNKKINKLQKRANYLNNLKIDKLIYHNSLGTNLEIGLPNNYLFQSAEGKNLVNMPTEEVFTSPDRLKVNGKVYSSKPLFYNNKIIEDFSLEFKDGKIINVEAKNGLDILKGIINTDEGSHYLGEVALVDYDSPISKTKVLFKNTLFDENASCHLAIGTGFAECIKNGLEKTNEELLKLGINYSNEHVDFFIGTEDLQIEAILKDNKCVTIMKNGNFVEE